MFPRASRFSLKNLKLRYELLFCKGSIVLQKGGIAVFLVAGFIEIYKNFFNSFSPTKHPLMFAALVVMAAMLIFLAFAVSLVVGFITLFGWVFVLPAMIYLIDKR